jgi:GTPase
MLGSWLHPKLRALVLPSRRKILLSDTVGFIRNLPHTLITSFRATLEEVEKAEVLLHVQDCSSLEREQQKEEVEKVLAELGSLGKPIISVLNKIDLLPPAEHSAYASGEWVAAVSAQTGEGVSHLLELMDRALTADPIVEEEFLVPQREGAVLAALDAGALIFKREFSGDLVDLAVAGPASLLARYRQYRHAQTGPKAGTGRESGSGAISHETGPV